jgi:FkbM family methyltransferase
VATSRSLGRPSLPSLYTVKKAALAPRTAYYRAKERDMDPQSRSIFELHYYRKPAYEFLVATMYCPDILVDFDLDADSIVLDVGAYTGEWAAKVRDRVGCTVHAFEPAPGLVAALETRFAADDRVHVHPYGLGARDETALLELAGPGSTTFGDGSHPATEVAIRDVAEVLEELGVRRIDLLKLNIEGGEYDVLDRLASTGWLLHVDQLLVQFHEWHPRAYQRRWANRRALRRHHELVWDYSFMWEHWRLPRPTPARGAADPG